METEIPKERIKAVEDAYLRMKGRGWGFASNGNGFGDPEATMTIVGLFDGVVVRAIASDPDCVKAVEKAEEAWSPK